MTLQQELDSELAKRDAIRQKQLARYSAGSASRARTTTSNAAADRVNDRIHWLRDEIKKERTQCQTTKPSP